MAATAQSESARVDLPAPSHRPPVPPAPIGPEDLGEHKPIPWRTVWRVVGVVVLLVIAVFIAVAVTNHKADQRLHKAKEENALRDLRNRVLTQQLATGQFVDVFTHKGQMIAVWQASDGLKTCNLQVVAPTKGVPRYSTAAYTATKDTFTAIKSDPTHAIGCYGTDSTDSFGGAPGG